MRIALTGTGGINKVHAQAAQTFGSDGWTNMIAVYAAFESSRIGKVVEVK